MVFNIQIQEQDFDTGAEVKSLAALGGGAVASFVGQVRDDGAISALELEHYPAMTKKALEQIAETASKKWPLRGLTVIHRVGKLNLGANIVLVCTSSDHRQAALEACSYIIDRLKTDAPFWKKEWSTDGTAQWVEERQTDIDAAKQWDRR